MAKASRKSVSSKKNKSKRPLVRWLLGILLIVLLVGAYIVLVPNTGSFSRDEFVYIRTGATYEEVKDMLKESGFVRDIASFDLVAKEAGYPNRIHPGKYQVKRGMGNLAIVRLLRSGRQTPVKIVLRKLRTQRDFIRVLSTQLEPDSNTLERLFSDRTYLAQFGLDTNTVLCGVFPDTYEFYWNTTADKAFRKIQKSAAAFWTDARKQKAKAQNLTQTEVMVLASIVDEESNRDSEKGNIASAYMNRLTKGMRLQADPTARFAWGDFSIRRITSVQTSFPSPYNTYYVAGLPPGPICTPSKSSINAVLNAPKTNYLYFCAKEDFSGYHRFAATYSEHMQNARLYQQALNARSIH